ncbi:YciI family protein [Paenibacillus hamazuiensis]|uniref:YciI family protein n=1 Tax=Paenibacillus hamazuiensis TaxID=2936508 RepID=UPI00200CF271|nr:YciI family protein [Paenibacillus hamazuiensis]
MNMHYTILFYETPEDFARRSDPERQQEYLAGWSHYVKALRESGIVVSGAGLDAPSTAASLRRHGGEMRVQDGPVTETKEQLGGFFVIDVPDLDAALEWAARCPNNAVEVRRNLPPMK